MVKELGLGPAWNSYDDCMSYLIGYCKQFNRNINNFNIVEFTESDIIKDDVTGLLSINK
jgi:hypothetical protein